MTGYGQSGSSYEPAEIIGLDPTSGAVKWAYQEGKFLSLPKVTPLSAKLIYGHYANSVTINWLKLPKDKSTPLKEHQWTTKDDDRLGRISDTCLNLEN